MRRPAAEWRFDRADSRGQGTVEFALVAILFFTMFFGVEEVARYVYGANAVTHAAREGARWAIAVNNIPPGQATACNSSLAGLKGAVTASAQGLGGSLTTTATDDPSSPPAWCQVTVTWQYTPAAGAFGLKPTAVSSTAKEYYN